MFDNMCDNTAMKKLGNDWDEILAEQFSGENYLALREKLKSEYKSGIVYPEMGDIYNAFRLTPYSEVKVVILGQDPYHGAGQAHGLAFSVKEGTALPPSLQNIFSEISRETSTPIRKNGDLSGWAKQGVLLLNTYLTVRANSPMSHHNLGWAEFTDNVIKILSEREKPIIFLLWGKPAQQKSTLIDERRHFVLKAPHPSPLSAHRGFFGCGHFNKVNEILAGNGETQINWEN